MLLVFLLIKIFLVHVLACFLSLWQNTWEKSACNEERIIWVHGFRGSGAWSLQCMVTTMHDCCSAWSPQCMVPAMHDCCPITLWPVVSEWQKTAYRVATGKQERDKGHHRSFKDTPPETIPSSARSYPKDCTTFQELYRLGTKACLHDH